MEAIQRGEKQDVCRFFGREAVSNSLSLPPEIRVYIGGNNSADVNIGGRGVYTHHACYIPLFSLLLRPSIALVEAVLFRREENVPFFDLLSLLQSEKVIENGSLLFGQVYESS